MTAMPDGAANANANDDDNGRRWRAALALAPDQADALAHCSRAALDNNDPCGAIRHAGRRWRLTATAEAASALDALIPQVLRPAALAYQAEDYAGFYAVAAALLSQTEARMDPHWRSELGNMLHNAAFCLQAANNNDALAIACAELAWRINGSHHTLDILRILYLNRQDYAAAWRRDAWDRLAATIPRLWNGRPGDGALVISTRNGLGDFLQFMRFIPHARRRMGRVIVQLKQEVIDGLTGAPMLDGVTLQADRPDEPDAAYCDVIGLPNAMGLAEAEIRVATPYLFPPADLLADWRRVLRRDRRPRVGVVWSSWSKKDHRSVDFAFFSEMIARLDAMFIGVHIHFDQTEIRGLDFPENFQFFGATKFQTTACIIGSLDLLIAPDGGMAHLGCALGVETWVLLAAACDWRWNFPDGRSPWYDNARLFRQPQSGDWDSVRRQVEQALTVFIDQQAVTTAAISGAAT